MREQELCDLLPTVFLQRRKLICTSRIEIDIISNIMITVYKKAHYVSMLISRPDLPFACVKSNKDNRNYLSYANQRINMLT